MSTMGRVEQAIKELSRTAELVGYALERANRADGKPEHASLVAKANEAHGERVRAVDALLEAIHHHAADQYETGLEMGRQSALKGV